MKIFIAALMLLATSVVYAQDNTMEGTWKGSFTLNGSNVGMIFNINHTNGKYAVKLDVPVQNIMGLKADTVIIENKNIEISFELLKLIYNGKINETGKMIGSFVQGGYHIPLDMEKVEKEVRYQALNDLYTATNVEFTNQKAGIKLRGTLTMPKNKTNVPAVVLISGSGLQNRDEELMGQRPFERIADYLSSRGIAVLRYDDRGFAESEGDAESSDMYDLTEDALAAFNFLKQNKQVDSKKIGLIGHSEGGGIAYIAASEHKDITFIIPLAGPAITGEEIILGQSRRILETMNAPEENIQAAYNTNKTLYELAKNGASTNEMAEKMKELGMPDDAVKANAKILTSKSYVSLLKFNPAEYISKISCPVLALFGEKDVQVIVPDNNEALEKLVKDNNLRNFTVKVMPNLNHIFQESVTGMLADYGRTEYPAMNDDTLKMVYDFISKQ